MSKEEKHNKISSATELRQSPLLEKKVIKGKKKIKTVKKSDHKHNYVINNIGPSWLRNANEGYFFEKTDNEYITINSECSVCGRKNVETQRVFIDEWKEKYERIYLEQTARRNYVEVPPSDLKSILSQDADIVLVGEINL